MPVLPFRGLAEKGILHDPNPYQLDLNAWSDGSGVRFHGNKVMRAPIFREVYSGLPAAPVFCVGYRPSTGHDQVFIAADTGQAWRYASGALTNVTPVGYVNTSDPRAFTSAFLGDVTYINRPSGPPLYYGPASTAFAALPAWPTGWTCRSLRTFNDYCVALNVTKGSTAVPSLVKWSDLALAGQPPGSWDFTDSTKNAGENPLEDLDTPIVDGLAMRGVFVIYSQNQIWSMEPVDNNDIFHFRRMFSEGGMIAPNCGVEVDGRHYVFGTSDIYVHDGVQKQSIIDKRNRDYVFRNLNMKASEVCFVAYMPKFNEIVFGYQSGDSSAVYGKATRCNRGAIYNIPSDTWAFVELPNVSSIAQANIDSVLTWQTCGTRTFANVGGTYWDQENGYDAHVVAVSSSLSGKITQHRLLAYDFMNKGSLAYPYSTECNAPVFVERVGLALDQVGSDLTTYKLVRRVYPLVSMFDNVPVQIQIGGSNTPSGPVKWDDAITFNPVTQYKVDTMQGGRYLAIRFTVNAPCDFEIAGFDLDVVSNGRR